MVDLVSNFVVIVWHILKMFMEGEINMEYSEEIVMEICLHYVIMLALI